MHRSLLFSALTALTACSARLTAPEAEAILSAIDQPLGSDKLRERLWTRMGSGDELARLGAATPVVVAQDGRSVPYSAIVFERLMVPPSGSGRSACLGPRWSLLLWRNGKSPEGMVLTGGRFDRSFSAGRLCEDISFMDPAPGMFRYPPERGGEQAAWVSSGGRGDITPGLDAGPCEFLPLAEAEALRRKTGITCRRTRHRVHFRSTLHPIEGSPATATVSGTMRVRLPPVEVVGFRYTIDCGLPQAVELCGRTYLDHVPPPRSR